MAVIKFNDDSLVVIEVPAQNAKYNYVAAQNFNKEESK